MIIAYSFDFVVNSLPEFLNFNIWPKFPNLDSSSSALCKNKININNGFNI